MCSHKYNNLISLLLPFVCVYNNTKKQKSDEKWEWPGSIHDMKNVGWTQVGCRGRGKVLKCIVSFLSVYTCRLDHTNTWSPDSGVTLRTIFAVKTRPFLYTSTLPLLVVIQAFSNLYHSSHILLQM